MKSGIGWEKSVDFRYGLVEFCSTSGRELQSKSAQNRYKSEKLAQLMPGVTLNYVNSMVERSLLRMSDRHSWLQQRLTKSFVP